MNKRRITFNINWLVLLLFLLIPCTAKAGDSNATPPDSSRLQNEQQLCQELQDKIKNNQDTRKFVKASIQMGHNACGVIKCAIKGGGDLKQIFEGAVEAGATKDVVSRCALDAGANAKDVAFILNNMDLNVCYILPEEPEVIISPLHDRKSPTISPSGF